MMKNRIDELLQKKGLGRRNVLEFLNYLNLKAIEKNLSIAYTRQAIYLWIHNKTQPDRRTVPLIAEYFKKPVNKIFYIADDKTTI